MAGSVGVALSSTTTFTTGPSLAHRRRRFSPSAKVEMVSSSSSSSSSIFLLQSFPRCALNRLSRSPLTPNIPSYSGFRWSGTGTRSGSRSFLLPRFYSQRSVVASAQSSVFRVLQTALKVAKDGIEAGTSFVPDSVPRPFARIGVTGVAGVVTLFLLKSFLSSLFFLLAMMGLIYFAFISLNKDEGPRGGGGGGGGDTSFSTDDESLEEARRIMEKYK